MQTVQLVLLSCLLGLLLSTHSTTSSRAQDKLQRTCNAKTEVCRLSESGPVVATHDGQVIEGLRIKAINEPGILVQNLSNVVIRNVEIIHQGGYGIYCGYSPALLIENVSIIHSGEGTASAEENNIDCHHADGLNIRNARLTGGSAGVYVYESAQVHLSYLEGYNFRGPTPRGMLAQFDRSPNCILEDFSAINDPVLSRTEDNVSIYMSDGCIVRRGLLDGNNGPWSVGVMFEHSQNGLVEDVDTVRQGNGSFSAYPGHHVTFRRTRARDNICTDQGRGLPVSGGVVWTGSPDSSGLRIEESTYFNICDPDNMIWDTTSFDLIQITEDDFSPRAPIKLDFPWE